MKKVIIIFLIICCKGILSQTPSTKLRLFAQTTGFDSIVAKNDSLIFYTPDSIHKAYLPYLLDSVTYKNDSLKIFQNNLTLSVEINDNSFGVTQTSHGFSVPVHGVLPLVYNTSANRYDLALADTVLHASDVLMVRTVNTDSLIIQNTGYLNVNHGLDVGYWWMLDDVTPGGIKRADTTITNCDSGQVLQRLFFTASPTKILLQPEEPYICENEPEITAPQMLAVCPQMRFNYFNEAQYSWGFSVQNSTGTPVGQWQAVIENANYQIDPSQISNNGDFTYIEVDNLDGTYDHYFNSNSGIPAYGGSNNFSWGGVNFGFTPTSSSKTIYCN